MMSMKKIRRLVKKYERWFMIGLVVVLLVIFTVMGSITGSGSSGGLSTSMRSTEPSAVSMF